jgi:hypothetical protein
MDDPISQLFDELVDLPPAERERILQGRNIPPEIRAEVESMLRFDGAGDRILIESVSSAASKVGPAANRIGPARGGDRESRGCPRRTHPRRSISAPAPASEELAQKAKQFD